MTSKARILLTGATGFVGRALLDAFLKKHRDVALSLRYPSEDFSKEATQYVLGDITAKTDWSSVIKTVDIVVHTAARVHIMDDLVANSLTEFRSVNTVGTLNLAQQAAEAGVKRFIFISSIKVNGEETQPSQPFKEDDSSIPTDPYSLSKYEAEQGLLKLAQETEMEVVIIRPPLVYGPGVKANFSLMMKWLEKSFPLPFGAIDNQRSLVALDNLVSFIIHCIDHPKAANEIFLISDGEDVSTTELLQKVAKAFGKKTFLLPVPVGIMRFFAKLLGKEDVANRLFGSLQVDSSKARDLLGWRPVTTMDEQLKKTAETYTRNQ